MKIALYSTLPDIEGPLEGLGGNAVDSVLAGLWVAAALHPGVILGSVQIMVAGPGMTPSCVDGRVRQPGLGAERPRGHTGTPPDAAFAAAPMMPIATITATATLGTLTLRQSTAPARGIAKDLNRARARVIENFSQQGPLAQATLIDALTYSLGPLHGGIVTAKDLEPKTPAITPVVIDREGAFRFGTAPWASEDDALRSLAQPCDVLCAADAKGHVAVAVIHHPEGGAMVDDLGLRAPPLATPVRRGVTREPVGSACAASFPVAFLSAPEANEGVFTHVVTSHLGSLDALAEKVRATTDVLEGIPNVSGVLAAAQTPRRL